MNKQTVPTSTFGNKKVRIQRGAIYIVKYFDMRDFRGDRHLILPTVTHFSFYTEDEAVRKVNQLRGEFPNKRFFWERVEL